MSSPAEVTRLLLAHGDGDSAAMERLLPILYDELKHLARARLRGERPDHTLNTTGLVHEAYLKLIDIHRVAWQNRVHFLAMASTVMRRILINHARQRKALKRGGGEVPVELKEDLYVPDAYAETLLELDDFLQRFQAVHPRPADVVHHRYFGGLTNEETADVLGVSLSTVERDLRFARAWLSREWRGDLDVR